MHNNFPLVCICIPTYNAADTVQDTIESIIAQTYPNIVIHISDNASTDNTIKVLESINDPRITIHSHNINTGGEGNFNRCIQLAEGKYTAIFHADDLYTPEMITKQVAFLEAHSEAGAVFTEASLINDCGEKKGEILFPEHIESKNGLYDFKQIFKAMLLHSNFFICPSVMVRTEVYQHEIKCWRGDKFSSSADLDVWLRILKIHSIGYLTEKLMCYRISDNQWSAEIRLGVERADFFLVTDYYLAQESVLKVLDSVDLRNYKRLERRDKVMRAVNLVLTDCSGQIIGELLGDVFSRDALIAGMTTKRGIFVLIIGIYVKLLDAFNLQKLGKLPLKYMKRAFGK